MQNAKCKKEATLSDLFAFCILHFDSMSCIFCTDVTQAGDVVHESAHAWVVLHEDWAVPGHAMVVSRRHVQNLSDLTEHEWELFSRTLRRAERALLRATGAER